LLSLSAVGVNLKLIRFDFVFPITHRNEHCLSHVSSSRSFACACLCVSSSSRLVSSFTLSPCQLMSAARCAAKTWISPTNSSSHVSAATKSACGAGIAYERTRTGSVLLVEHRTVTTRTSSQQLTLKMSFAINERRQQLRSVSEI
jgi:hypothetical protein